MECDLLIGELFIVLLLFLLIIRGRLRSTRTATLFPSATRCLSGPINCANRGVAMQVRGEENRRRRGFHPVEKRRRRHGPAWRHPKGGTGKRRDGVARLGHSAAKIGRAHV